VALPAADVGGPAARRSERSAAGSGDDLALREPPLKDGPSGGTWLRRVDRYWDVLCFIWPPALLLMVASVIALVWGSGPQPLSTTVALVAVAAALLWVVVLLLVMLLRLLYQLVSRRPAEMASGQLRTLNPTLTLLHAATTAGATDLVARAKAAGPGPLLVLRRGITGAAPERHGPDGLRIEPLPELPVLVVRHPADPPRDRRRRPDACLGVTSA
jgi:hypothetical protein